MESGFMHEFPHAPGPFGTAICMHEGRFRATGKSPCMGLGFVHAFRRMRALSHLGSIPKWLNFARTLRNGKPKSG